MPSSRPNTIPYVVHLVNYLQPESILDVSVGFGKWGYLFREYTDIVNSERNPGRYAKKGWQVRIEGIEAFKDYLHEGHRFIYDKIHIGNAIDILPTLGRYDIIFFGDIIEHFPLQTGKKLLKTAMRQCNKCVILTTPKYDTAQIDLCNNLLERHRSVWGRKDFRALGKCSIALADKGTYVVAYPGPLAKPFKLRIKQYGPPEPTWMTVIKKKLRPVKRYFLKKRN